MTFAETKELITVGVAMGLRSVEADGVKIVFGEPAQPQQDQSAQEQATSTLPEELRHYSAAGKAAWSRT